MSVFENNARRYEAWFDRHHYAYMSELAAVRAGLPNDPGHSLEIGAGTGRFAVPLGITVGVEPSLAMGQIAESRGLHVVEGVAEALPFEGETFDSVLMVTTICFVDDPQKTLQEAFRVLKPGGRLVVGFVDRNSRLGGSYEDAREKSVFYRDARFFTVDEVISDMMRAGFGGFSIYQTIFKTLNEIENEEPVKEGYGEGSFVVVAAERVSKLGHKEQR